MTGSTLATSGCVRETTRCSTSASVTFCGIACASATLIPATASGELSRPVCCEACSTQADKDIVTTSVPRQSNSTAFAGKVTASASHRHRSATTTNSDSHPVPPVKMHHRRQIRSFPLLVRLAFCCRSSVVAEPVLEVRLCVSFCVCQRWTTTSVA